MKTTGEVAEIQRLADECREAVIVAAGRVVDRLDRDGSMMSNSRNYLTLRDALVAYRHASADLADAYYGKDAYLDEEWKPILGDR